MQNLKSDISDRELVFSRLLDAPVKLVWEVWSIPDHIKHWWGPAGFTNTIKKMDVRLGGEWNLIMHGPDGTDYDIKNVFTEIVEHKKIVLEQIGNFKCTSTIEFESRGDKTFLCWRMLFESREYLIEVAKLYGVDTGLKQNVERLNQYLLQFHHE